MLLIPPAFAVDRPEGLTVGIGAGFEVPAALFAPNAGSARLRVNEDVSLEGVVVYAFGSSTTTIEAGDNESETTAKSSTIALDALVRYRLADNDRTDLLVLVAGEVDLSSSSTDPEGGDNDTESKSTTLGLGWGIGVEYWATTNWSVSADASNPLVALTSSTAKDDASESELKANALDVAIGWTPTVRILTHIYF